MNELKSCPFCRGEAEVIGYFQNGVANNYQYFVRCQKCKARPQLYGYTFTSKEKAIEAWNRRHSVDESPTIDAVEVVRCKDCVASIPTKTSNTVYCITRKETIVRVKHITKMIHAHWLTWEEMFPDSKNDPKGNLGVFCSACHLSADYETDFCPNCGAMMDEKEIQNKNTRHM